MALVNRRIYHIAGPSGDLLPKQLGVETSLDPELGYRMWCGRDAMGSLTRFLAKGKPALITTLRLTGGGTTGEIGILRHDAAGNVTGGKMTVDQFNTYLSDGPIGGQALLDTGAIGFGDASGILTGDVDKIFWDDSNQRLLVGFNPTSGDGLGNGSVGIAGDLRVSTIAYFEGTVRFNSSARMRTDGGFGFGDNYESIIRYSTAQTNNALFVGTPSSSNTMLLSRMMDVNTDQSLPVFSNPTLAISSSSAGSTQKCLLQWDRMRIGENSNASHSFSMVRGRYVESFFEGAHFFGQDRFDSISGTCMGFSDWVLVAESNGDETVMLRNAFDDTGATFSLPDGFMFWLDVNLLSAVADADSTNNGFRHIRRQFYGWHNAGFSPMETITPEDVKARTAQWTIELRKPLGTWPTGDFPIAVEVGNTSNEKILHVATVRGIIRHTSFIASS